MDCTEVKGHLTAYHFGTSEVDERDAIDAHLLGCTGCLKAYLALKHAAERGPVEVPSAAMRLRLRAEVAARFERPRRSFFVRRIPLYQGLVAAALAAAIAVFVVGQSRAPHIREGLPEVDTSRATAASQAIY